MVHITFKSKQQKLETKKFLVIYLQKYMDNEI